MSAVADFVNAGRNGDIPKLQAIMDSQPGFDINAESYIPGFAEQGTCLIAAVYKGKLEVVEFLLSRPNPADVNKCSSRLRNSPLIVACRYKFPEVAKALLYFKADISIKNSMGTMALEYAKTYSITAIIDMLDNPKKAAADYHKANRDKLDKLFKDQVDRARAISSSTPPITLSNFSDSKGGGDGGGYSKEDTTTTTTGLLTDSGSLSSLRSTESSSEKLSCSHLADAKGAPASGDISPDQKSTQGSITSNDTAESKYSSSRNSMNKSDASSSREELMNDYAGDLDAMQKYFENCGLGLYRSKKCAEAFVLDANIQTVKKLKLYFANRKIYAIRQNLSIPEEDFDLIEDEVMRNNSSGSTQSRTSPSSPSIDVDGYDIAWQHLSIDPTNFYLGKGTFGLVVKAKLLNYSLLPIDVAVKIIVPEIGPRADEAYNMGLEAASHEVKMVVDIERKLLNKDNIIKIYGLAQGQMSSSFISEFGNKRAIGIVMRLESGGTLEQFLNSSKGLRVVDRLHIMHQIAADLTELHQLGVIHGDIKPANLLLSNHVPPFIRLADFGQSMIRQNLDDSLSISSLASTATVRGTPLYSAPEMLELHGAVRARTSRSTDVYACGIVFWEILCAERRLPFADIKNEAELISLVKSGTRPSMSELCHHIPIEVKSLIELCWNNDREKRISALECFIRLNQQYIVMSGESYDIFLSHPWNKKAVLRHVKRYLFNTGYKVWYDEEDMEWNLKKSMEDGIIKSKVFIACISRDYEKSRNCMFELLEAIKHPNKPILTLTTDADPFSWAGTVDTYGNVKTLCNIDGQGKMFIDIGPICDKPGWDEKDETLIPKENIELLNAKLEDLVKFLRCSHINCHPSLASIGGTP